MNRFQRPALIASELFPPDGRQFESVPAFMKCHFFSERPGLVFTQSGIVDYWRDGEVVWTPPGFSSG